MSTLRVEVVVEDFRDYKPLDSARLILAGLDSQNSENLSGNYVVDTVIHRIRGGKYTASLILARESLGNMRGRFSKGDIDIVGGNPDPIVFSSDRGLSVSDL